MDVSHFTMAGFAIDTQNAQSLSGTAKQFVSSCIPLELSKADLVCVVKDASGAELRIGMRRDSSGHAEIMSMDPSFVGQGRATVEIVSDVSDPNEKPFGVTISAHFSGEQTPIVFDLADPSQASAFRPGTTAIIDIAAFSFNPEIFSDEAAYMRAQDNSGPKIKFGANFFIPTGSFFEKVGGAMPDNATRPIAYADFAGKVLESKFLANAVGGERYWWAVVRTYDDTTIDVVIDPQSIAQEPKVGSILRGRFWLSGRLAPSPQP
jgi:hypothetical protein